MTHVTDAVARVTTDKNIGDSQAAIPMVDSVLRFHQQHEAPETADGEGDANVLVTVVMPCLNEARTLAACIEQAHAGCRSALASRNPSGDTAGSATQPSYEIIIADNGSTDGSQAIATEHGVKVVSVEQKGYGAASCPARCPGTIATSAIRYSAESAACSTAPHAKTGTAG